MANRFPLIVNAADAKIYELAAGDNLDLTSSNINNNGATIVLPTASGTLATLAGTETLTNKTLSSGTLSGTFAGDATLSGSITLSATTALTIPVGTTAQRPTAATGQIRFNSSLTSFEGYNGTAWSSLGGVKSVDGFTYIIAETSSGASNGELEFYTETAAGTAAAKQGGWNYTRLLTNTPIDFAGSTSGTTRVQATAAASGILTLPAATGTVITSGDTGTVTSTMIADGTIVNGDISASAAIAVSKLAASTISGITLGNNLNTLTLNVSGTGLSGSTTYNGSAAATFTVTSNATSANTASTIVARDANGDFTAGTVTAVDGFQATSAAPFFLNATTVAANFTIPTNYNAMSAGPVTIADGVTVTVPDGSVWTIV